MLSGRFYFCQTSLHSPSSPPTNKYHIKAERMKKVAPWNYANIISIKLHTHTDENERVANALTRQLLNEVQAKKKAQHTTREKCGLGCECFTTIPFPSLQFRVFCTGVVFSSSSLFFLLLFSIALEIRECSCSCYMHDSDLLPKIDLNFQFYLENQSKIYIHSTNIIQCSGVHQSKWNLYVTFQSQMSIFDHLMHLWQLFFFSRSSSVSLIDISQSPYCQSKFIWVKCSPIFIQRLCHIPNIYGIYCTVLCYCTNHCEQKERE